MTFSITKLSVMAHHFYAECFLCCVSLMQSVTYKSFMLIFIMLSVIMLYVVMLSIIMLYVLMQSVI
jgi:hypothetical protein